MIKKLFQRDLKVKSEKITSYDNFYKNFRKKYKEISSWKENHFAKLPNQPQYSSPAKHPLLDDRINESIKRGKRSNIFHISKPIEISKKEYIFLMTYFWLSQCMDEIYPFLMQFPDLIEVIGSDFYSKVCNILVGVLGSPLAGLIFYIFEALTELIGKEENF